MTTTNSDEAPLSSNMMLCWSDEDGEVTVKELQQSHDPPRFFCPGSADFIVTYDQSSWCVMQPVASPSPVFPAETEGQQAASRPTGPNCRYKNIQSILLGPVDAPEHGLCHTHTNRGEHSTAQAQPISSQAAARGAGHPAPFGSTVHYYWGIPFCPRGLDPDRYTQVGGAQRR